MSELPSIYSSVGLSQENQRKIITSNSKKINSSAGNGGISLEIRVQNELSKNSDKRGNFGIQEGNGGGIATEESDGDIIMLGTEDQQEVNTITDYVANRRHVSDFPANEQNENFFLQKAGEKLALDSDMLIDQPDQKEFFLIVDTNFILSHLNILEDLKNMYNQYSGIFKIIIPITVMHELDGLKKSNSGESYKSSSSSSSSAVISNESLSHLARWANDWIYNNLAESNAAIRGQRLNERIDKYATKDDSILDCCIYFQQKYPSHLVILLSNDKNFCTKALVNGILTISFRQNMNSKLIIEKIIEENLNRGNGIVVNSSTNLLENYESNSIHSNSVHSNSGHDDFKVYEHTSNGFNSQSLPAQQLLEKQQHQQTVPQTMISDSNPNLNAYCIKIPNFNNASQQIYQEIQSVLLSAIDECMTKEYEDDLELVEYDKDKVVSINDCCLVMSKFWVSVFGQYFKKSVLKPQSLFKTHKDRQRLIHIPKDINDLTHFVDFWSEILRCLYLEKDENQISSLQVLFRRWDYIIENIVN
ncbi:hypothetical protein PACTADRAFT_50462 [Pachysolen tannophilus NRRL Y-2460]|uniref:Transcriptional protein SWT1 n=1 Tax=Pachysolen tannophilus NRRL Y-2460 TaxID=669874 RepID=A0A1E4TS46_PACTA|nr:hypothetical protein PACTADRAFT_50462 [Pachysolen tannophilus NRRL Y-2460]